MTTPPPHPHVARRDLSILTAGIPALLGFRPANSLVLCAFNQGLLLTLGATMRADLPAPEHAEVLTEHLLAAIKHNNAVAVLAVVIGGGTQEEHRPLVDALRKSLNDNNIVLIHTSWVNDIAADERWHCYLDPQCTDTIPDPQISAIAMADAVAGNVTFRTREELASQLAPEPPETLARREELLDEQLRTPQTQYTEEDLDADVTLVTTLLREAEESLELPTLTDKQVVRLARALSHTEVKDECLAAALTETPEAAERVWTVLVRGLPSPERAEAAVLLAMSAYLRGAGVLAALAVKTALDANPNHGLARLLDTALTSAVPPDNLRALLIKSILKNEGLDDDLFWMTTPATADPPQQPEPPEQGRQMPPSQPDDTEPSDRAFAAERSGLPEQADQPEQRAVCPEHVPQRAWRAERPELPRPFDRPEDTHPRQHAGRQPERPEPPWQDAAQPEPSASRLPTRLEMARLDEPFPAAVTTRSAPEPLVTIRGPAPCALDERTAATLGLLAPSRSAPLDPLAAFLPLSLRRPCGPG